MLLVFRYCNFWTVKLQIFVILKSAVLEFMFTEKILLVEEGANRFLFVYKCIIPLVIRDVRVVSKFRRANKLDDMIF